jgi:predicted nucleic acid-binding protein
VKWFIPEDDAKLAEAFQPGRVRVLVPDCFTTEVVNAFRVRVRRGFLGASMAFEMTQSLRRVPVKIVPSRPLLPRAMTLACTSDLALYDALYVALAERLNCPLVTADTRQLRSGRAASATADIRPLAG